MFNNFVGIVVNNEKVTSRKKFCHIITIKLIIKYLINNILPIFKITWFRKFFLLDFQITQK